MTARDVLVASVVFFILAIAFFVTFSFVTNVYDRIIQNTIVASSSDAVSALEGGKSMTNRMDYVYFAIFIGIVLSIMITGWFTGGHPIFMFIYFIFIVITVVLSMFFSNIYVDVTAMPAFSAVNVESAFPLMNTIMLQLPIIMSIIGIIGMVVMFAKPGIEGSGGNL
jgi:hypothetical protein